MQLAHLILMPCCVLQPPDGTPQPAAGWPVVVYIHGGAFVFGRGADYDGEPFALTQGLVVVTLK